MKAIYSGSRTYTLFNDREHVMGTIVYPSMFSRKAIVKAKDADPVNVDPRKLGSSLVLLRNDMEIGVIKIKWGTMYIKIQSADQPRDYIFKRKGFWNSRYVLLNETQEQLVAIVPKFSWKSWRHDYHIELTRGERYAVDTVTTLLTVYLTIYLMAAAASGSAV